MTATDLPALNIADLRAILQRREVSPLEVLESLHARIAKVDPQIDAYLSLDFEQAKKEAEKVDVNLPLGGVPIAIKDIISVAGQPCTCASKMLRNYRALYDATVIRKLRAAGAIPFGKTNMDEFAMGSSTENSSVKVTHNPWDFSRVPGGSSGGSAAAVAADEAFGALGHRYGWLDSATGGVERGGWFQTQLRSCFEIWIGRVRIVTRSSRTANENSARRCADHEGDRGTGFAGHHCAQRVGSRLHRWFGKGFARHAAWFAEGVHDRGN